MKHHQKLLYNQNYNQLFIYDVGVENPIDFSTLFSDTFENLYSVDDRYGPVTKNVTIKLGNQVISQIDENSDVGNYKIILSATDSNNNEASESINVNVFDNTPIINLFMQPDIVELSDIQENGGYIDTEFRKYFSYRLL